MLVGLKKIKIKLIVGFTKVEYIYYFEFITKVKLVHATLFFNFEILQHTIFLFYY